MHGDIFTQLSLVIVVAALVSMIMRALRQPLIMGYILTGIIVGPFALHLITDSNKEAFDTFSEIGIALLLFIIGLELSVAVVKRLGRPVFLTAFALLFTVGVFGFIIASAFHFTTTESVIVGLAMFFSSTIIIAKVLSDKNELTRLNGQIAIGVILFDDIVATFALLYIAAQSGDPLTGFDISMLILKGVAAVGVLAVVSMKILPPAMRRIAKSQELLFLFALAWGFGVASAFNAIGFSVEVGALFAGVALAHLPYTHQIGARLKPLRDFFIILFFIILGERLQLESLSAAMLPALILSFAVLTMKPLVVMMTLGLLGYTKRTSFKTGINLSQISEFSIILVVLATTSGLVDEQLSAIITIVAIITIAVSTYLMQYDDWIYSKVEKSLHFFERSVTNEKPHQAKSYDQILFGYLNGGQHFVKTFQSMKLPYVVVDYDPDVIEILTERKVPYLYGDATDPELLNEIHIESAKLIVNTISEHTVNKALLRYVVKRNKKAVIICYSNDHNEAAELYEMGATYVMLPHYIGSNQLSSFIQTNGLSRHSFEEYREKHLVQLKKSSLHNEIDAEL